MNLKRLWCMPVFWLLVSLIFQSCVSQQSSNPHAADVVLRGGAIYTMDAARSWAAAVAISGDSLAFVGADTDVEKWIGPQTRVIDLQGKMALPGFHDSPRSTKLWSGASGERRH